MRPPPATTSIQASPAGAAGLTCTPTSAVSHLVVAGAVQVACAPALVATSVSVAAWLAPAANR